MRKTATRNDAVYLRIADAIRHDILSRGLAAHTRLPSEPTLVRKHRAARATVRRAMAKLQEEGLVYSRQAVGTFVAEARVEQDLDQLFSFTEFMVYRGIRPGSRVITAEKQRIDDPQSALLHYLGPAPGRRSDLRAPPAPRRRSTAGHRQHVAPGGAFSRSFSSRISPSARSTT